mmetsp:Transcript_26685/g.39646  ORF Transcript_26685/g.39646 Transcript_26685/m.39646 type:complete len:250 (-) Transcript_26685:103-852(-)|eukprot:CAMPEP_0185033298 /NCGR_PEP_ID=MMETSP1103-20130426/22101_1 /TAXON_ID=36769 /ORGANISM="Paraphysomonas bandaiensis, Strain Caron Lab Isolate" /LENGTH=249 /DNA_ID=CAMNT_0027569513 /DNA_START=37 /DNA_END=786 /DNA_ORIENTATION=-
MGTYSSKDVSEDSGGLQDGIPSRNDRKEDEKFPTYTMPPAVNIIDSEVPKLPSDHEEYVPTVFRWEHGGRNVYITGTFNNWEKQIPMHRSGNDFTYIHNLKRAKHAYKFVVDDEWRFAPDQPTVADIEGRINNFIDVSEFNPYIGDDSFFERSKERKIPDTDFHQIIPDVDEYAKEPPALPPHLRHIILNKPSSSLDALSLPLPQPVSLNHLYCTAIKDGMMVLGVTERYKHKYVTQVFYSSMPITSNA